MLRTEKSSTVRLDEIDLKILDILQNDARITLKELSTKVNLSSPLVLSAGAVWNVTATYSAMSPYLTRKRYIAVSRCFAR